jgi:hypothetical protein
MKENKPTYAELEAEIARLKIANDNLWKEVRAGSVALYHLKLAWQEVFRKAEIATQQTIYPGRNE